MSRRRERIDRVHWGWAENYVQGCISDNDLKTAYRLNGKQHKPYTCRKNCKLNPNCLSGFGGQSLNQTIDKDAELESFRSNKLRVPGTYVGLKNLGNTCYINSLLQLWFHNIPFREAVYGWNALEDKQEIAKHYEVYNRPLQADNYEPLSSIAHLQYLFAEMQFGLKKYCDPEAFCRSLSIDVELQQDAQEFNKLYMQRLEESFQSSSNEKTRRVIQDQFRGEYSYMTTCCNCSKESEKPSYFYELELKVKNCNSILDSLQGNEFLNEEPLTGDNKYFCSNCNDKHNAFTRIRLQEIPPVLQLQLLRYEIDSTIGTRRKIHSAIQFPDHLDMSSYLDAPPNTFSYRLIGVLMHGGSTAFSGHYYAHINTVDGWHVFDDINVKKEKQLSLASEENLIPVAERKICGPKLKGFRSSSSVYMLVYRRIDKNELTDVSGSANTGEMGTMTWSDDASKKPEMKGGGHEKNGARKRTGKGSKVGKSGWRKKDAQHEDVSDTENYPENGISDRKYEIINRDNDSHGGDASVELNSGFNPACVNNNGEGAGTDRESLEAAILKWCTDGKRYEKLEDKPKDMNILTWYKLIDSDDSCNLYLVMGRTNRIVSGSPEESVIMNGDVNAVDGECEGKNCQNTDCSDSGTGSLPDSRALDDNKCLTPCERGERTEDDFECENSHKSDPSNEFIVFRSKMEETHWKMLPDYPKRAILKSRQEVQSSFDSQLIEIDSRIDTQIMVKEVAESIMPDSDMNDYEFISFEWLKMLTKNSVPPIDNTGITCKHGKLNVSKRSFYKAISTKAADFLYMKFGGGPRLKNDSLCRLCVENKARQVKLQMEVGKDSKLLPSLTKQVIEHDQKAFWVGKRTLRRWTNYVLSEIEDDGIEDDEEDGSNTKDGSGGEDGRRDASDVENVTDRLKNDNEDEMNESFNDDIVCVHDGLTVEENDRKLVSEVVWNVFLKYFPNAKVFERDHSPCVPCQNLASQNKEHRDIVRKNAVKEKELLKDLFEKKPTYDLIVNSGESYLVDSGFMKKWRKYMRSISRQTMLDAPRPEDLISKLLCESHGLLMYDPEVDVERFSALNKHEWEMLSSFYSTEQEVRIVKHENGGFITSVEVCRECLTRRRLAEAEQDLQNSYVNATVCVWKVDTNADDFDSDDSEEIPSKKRKLNTTKSEDVSVSNPPCKKPEQVRRSARARQPNKGKKIFVVNQFTTLKDLKIMIFNKFGVMPTDQHLSLNGLDLDVLKESLQLSDPEATLINLKVKPNDVIQLVADEPTPGVNICESEGFLMPEAGFKGTELGGK